jgi:hypothetical protein
MASSEQNQLRQWARQGAEQRLQDIAREMAAIHRAFPELRRRGKVVPTTNDGTAEATSGRRRGRRRMSREARRRISDAQKARWAKQRGEQQVAETSTATKPARANKASRRSGARKMSAAARKRISEAQKARWATLKRRQS